MAKIELTNGTVLQVTENKEEIFEILKGDKQFIFVKKEYTNTVRSGGCTTVTGTGDFYEIAVNRNNITQVF